MKSVSSNLTPGLPTYRPCCVGLMDKFPAALSTALLVGLSAVPASLADAPAAFISDISFTSNGGAYINDTIVNGTAPLGFTGTADLQQPFLNLPNSTIALGYGNYYAIALLGFGQMSGPGSVSFLLNGVTPYSENVTFPDPSLASGDFASFSLPDGSSVTVSATGLSADRIAIISDGGGLTGSGVPDAFYQFNYSATPEPSSLLLILGSVGTIVGFRRFGRSSQA